MMKNITFYQYYSLKIMEIQKSKILVIGFASVNFAAADSDMSTRYFRLISILGQI